MTDMQGGTAADVGAAAEQMADQHGAISQNDAGSGAAERSEGATEQQPEGVDDLAAERIAAEAHLRSEQDLLAYSRAAAANTRPTSTKPMMVPRSGMATGCLLA